MFYAVCIKQIRKQRPILWRSNFWMLHHDNAPVIKLIFAFLI